MDERQKAQAIQSLTKRIGRKPTEALLSILGRDKAFCAAMETSVGQEIMATIVSKLEDKLSQWLNEKDTPADRAETRAYLNIIQDWSGRIERYYQNQQKFEEGVK